MESRFLEPSVCRTSRYFGPNLISLGFASLKLYNFTLNFSNPRFLETPDNSDQFWLPWDKLTLDNSNLRKFSNHLMRTSITFTPFNKLSTSIICAKVPGTSRVSRLQRGNKLLQNYLSLIVYRLYRTYVLLCSVLVF